MAFDTESFENVVIFLNQVYRGWSFRCGNMKTWMTRWITDQSRSSKQKQDICQGRRHATATTLKQLEWTLAAKIYLCVSNAKTVMMMMTALITAKDERALPKTLTQANFLQYFCRAYDRVARNFLFLKLKPFGYLLSYDTIIETVHDILLPNSLSMGSYQGHKRCYQVFARVVTSFLYWNIIAVEVLALAIDSDL